VIKIRKESDEVLYPRESIVAVNGLDLEKLKKLALLNTRKRIRLCAHKTPDDKLHEMIIVHTKECYVRPHKHLHRAESITILEGEADLILFKDNGSIANVIGMNEVNSGKTFFHRISDPIYHMLIIRSDFLVFHESTEGPFNREDADFPEWAPLEGAKNFGSFMKLIEYDISKRINC
jgi:cupin fold WbuC family metalloprotein